MPRILALVDTRWSCQATEVKRIRIVLRHDLVQEAVRLSGEQTYSRTVERALADFVNRIKARRILELAGSGAWSGKLAEMRNDRPRGRRP